MKKIRELEEQDNTILGIEAYESEFEGDDDSVSLRELVELEEIIREEFECPCKECA